MHRPEFEPAIRLQWLFETIHTIIVIGSEDILDPIRSKYYQPTKVQKNLLSVCFQIICCNKRKYISATANNIPQQMHQVALHFSFVINQKHHFIQN
jgi:hypothetical protein